MLRDKKTKASTVPVSPARAAPIAKEAPPAAKPEESEEEEDAFQK